MPGEDSVAPGPPLKRRMSTQEEEFHKHKRAKPNTPQRAPPVPAAAAARRGAQQGPAAGFLSTASRVPQPQNGKSSELQLPPAREITQLPPVDGKPGPGDAVVYKLLEIGQDWAPQVRVLQRCKLICMAAVQAWLQLVLPTGTWQCTGCWGLSQMWAPTMLLLDDQGAGTWDSGPCDGAS